MRGIGRDRASIDRWRRRHRQRERAVGFGGRSACAIARALGASAPPAPPFLAHDPSDDLDSTKETYM